MVIVVCVDDLLVIVTSGHEINHFKSQMNGDFEMSDLCLLSYYFGIEVDQSNGCVILKQSSYANKILEKTDMGDCNSTKWSPR